MTETQASAQAADESQLRQRLIRRVGVAGFFIIALIAGLAIFDANQTQEPPPAVVAVTPKPPAAEPPTPVSPPPSAVDEKPAEAAKPETTAAAPEETSAPGAPPLRESPVAKAPTKPAVALPASIKPSVTPAPPEPAKTVQKIVPRNEGAAAAEDARRHFVVQMGVFSNLANAEEMRSKLDKAGIASQIEARVQVGPFNSRMEAEAAQKKLAALGLNGGMLVSTRK